MIASMLTLLLFVLFSTQQAAPPALEGTIVDDSTGRPVEGLQVRVQRNQATTDSAGRFAIAQMATGTYRLTTSKEGWISARRLGRNGQGQDGITVGLSAGQTVKDFTIRLQRDSRSKYSTD